MLKNKLYSCGICKTKPDQISHQKTHIESQKHKDKKELFELKLYRLKPDELLEQHKTDNITDIINSNETIVYDNKKLNNNDLDNNDIEYINIKAAMEEINIVSNKEALKDKIHEIHNFLRNNGAGYGMNALKVFNILYGLKKLEEHKIIVKCNLIKECYFSHLLELANNNKDEELASLILGAVSTSIYISDISELLFYEIPSNIKGSVFSYLIKEINKITLIEQKCNVLLSGKIYEYFIGRDESAISELGAYFTDRHIVEYIYSKLGNVVNPDSSIKSMIDMFGGSGGFTTGYINYINTKYPDFKNWISEINKVYHYDMNEDVIKSAALEFFCLTGVLPDMKNNIQYKNSFNDEFNNMKYDLVITNPPYGGDKNKMTNSQTKRNKIEKYIKTELKTLNDEKQINHRKLQLKYIETEKRKDNKEQDKTKVTVGECSCRIKKFAKNNNLKGNDKEACSLMLMMDLVEVGGTCIGVLKEGVFFNKSYKALRECLVKNFNVREVISVPQDQFENTSTKTSIIIFDNSENKTKEIKFYDLVVEKYLEDKFEEKGNNIVLTENKDDIKRVCDKLVSSATVEMILANKIVSLNSKDYNKKEIICGEGYELVKLGDVCSFLPKSKRNASFGQKEGQYNFYTSSDKVQKCDVVDYKDECIIVGDGGVANIKIDSNFSCSDHNHIFKSKNNKFIYNIIKSNMTLLSDGFKGSVLKNLSIKYLQNLQIPIPKSPAKIQEWTEKISKPYDEKNMKTNKIASLELKVQNEIKRIMDEEECEEMEFDKVCEFINGKKRNTTDGIPNGIYPLFSSSLNIDNWINEYDYNIQSIIMNTINGSGKFNVHCCEKFGATSNTLIFTSKTINIKYIYYYCLNNIETINNLANGSTKKKMGKSEISKLKIPIPHNKQLIQNLEPTFKQIEQLQQEAKQAEELYNKLILELAEEAIPSSKQIIIQEKEAEQSESESEPEPEPEPEPKIKIIKNKTQNSNISKNKVEILKLNFEPKTEVVVEPEVKVIKKKLIKKT